MVPVLGGMSGWKSARQKGAAAGGIALENRRPIGKSGGFDSMIELDDIVGRLVQESAPTINYSGLGFVDLILRRDLGGIRMVAVKPD